MPIKFANISQSLIISEISSGLAPVETPAFNNDGELRMNNKTYYFDGSKKMKFQSLFGGVFLDQTKVLSGVFTIGIAFAPTDDLSLGMLMGLENTDSSLELTEEQLSIKLDGKVAKDATLSNSLGGGFTDKNEIKFTPNNLNIIFIQRDVSNRLHIKNDQGWSLQTIDPDTDTTGNFSINRLGGNSTRYFNGYIGQILIEDKFLSAYDIRAISTSWMEEFYYPPYNL